MQLSDIKFKLLKGFEALGTKNGTAVPEGATDNRFAVAYEMAVAYTLASMADKRKELSKKEAQRVGILPDAYKPATEVQVYENNGLQIISKTASSAMRLDQAKLRTELIKAVGEEKATKIIALATSESKPATSFIFI